MIFVNETSEREFARHHGVIDCATLRVVGALQRVKRLQHGAEPADPDTAKEKIVKKDIHPDYVETTVTCTCGNTFTTRSTAKNGVIHADVCSQCHPFYTGKQKILDTGGRVARFEARYAKKKADQK